MADEIETLLSFWFGSSRQEVEAVPERMQRWFSAGPEFDAELAARFGALRDQAEAGELAAWESRPAGRLALILLLDQLPRNIFRATARAFATDPAAQQQCLAGLELSQDAALSPMERGFFYMPLQHAEDLVLQERSLACYRNLLNQSTPPWRPHIQGMLDYAVEHRDIIARFGRFPHRNQILGRSSTPDEQAFLDAGADAYGQS